MYLRHFLIAFSFFGGGVGLLQFRHMVVRMLGFLALFIGVKALIWALTAW